MTVQTTEAPPATGESTDQQEQQTEQTELGEAGKKALDRMKAERDEARRNAKANADAAAKLKTIEDEKLSAEERTAAKLAEADSKVAGIPALVAESLKTHLVALHKIDAEDAELFLTANEPELLLKQIARLTGGKGGGKGNYVAREGSTTTTPESEERAAARSLFGSRDS